MSRWFRYYDEALNDPKVQGLPPVLFKFWVNVLCVASKNNGIIPPLGELKTTLKARLDHVEGHLNDLINRALVDNEDGILRPHNWSKRQYKSDTSAERTKAWRDSKKGNFDVTETDNVTPPDTDTDTDDHINRKFVIPAVPGKRKPSKVPLPDNWKPSERAREIALRLNVDLRDQEERFRDYLASNAVQYANYDSAFCNFVKNAPKFNGSRGPPARTGKSYAQLSVELGEDYAAAISESPGNTDTRKPVDQFTFGGPDDRSGYRRTG